VKKILDERFYAEWKAAVSNWMLWLPLTARLQACHDNASWRWSSIDLGSFCPCGEGRTLTGGWRATTQEVQINVDVFWSG
jgi:hypothetical protein